MEEREQISGYTGSETQRFLYTPLDKTCQEIRLIRIKPSMDSASPIRLQLRHACLGSDLATGLHAETVGYSDLIQGSNNFTALSYTWGAVDPAYEIYIEGHTRKDPHQGYFTVRKSLFDFLVCMRQPSVKSNWFWIDQICINQDDEKEKGHQVNQMSQIYTVAAGTAVWLGASFAGSDEAMDVVARAADKNYTPFPRELGENSECLLQIMDLPYWKRLWVVQEIELSRKIRIHLGHKTMGAGHFFRAFDRIFDFTNIKHLAIDHPFFKGLDFNSLTHSGDKKMGSWMDVKGLAEDKQCFDVRDKAFGLLSLVLEPFQFFPDYSMSPQDVLLEILKQELAQMDKVDYCERNYRDLQKLTADWYTLLNTRTQPIDLKVVRQFLHRKAYPKYRDMYLNDHWGFWTGEKSEREDNWREVKDYFHVGPAWRDCLHLWRIFPSKESIRWRSTTMRGRIYFDDLQQFQE